MSISLVLLTAALPPLVPPGPAPGFPPMLLAYYGVFFTLIGACVGSFLNVVIWRLPHSGREVIYLEQKGKLSLSWPPSHCPVCDKPIPFYYNIPVLSWVMLRARCANCKAPIPIRYPMVEAATALLFLGFYLAYFVAHWNQMPGLSDGWPVYLLHVAFAAALLAGSAIDADLFIIPLGIPIFLTIIGLLGAVFIGPPFLPQNLPSIPSLRLLPKLDPAWWLAKPILGATFGVILANVLMKFKILPRSFDGVEFEHEADKPAANPEKEKPTPQKETAFAPPPRLTHFTPVLIAAFLLLIGIAVLWATVSTRAAALATLAGAIVVFLLGVLPRDPGQVDVTDEVMEEISGPHVRREILKECLFIAIPVVCAVIAHVVLPLPEHLPDWLERLLGSLLGFLTGAGVVWLVRIAGSLVVGREAMGIGDAHLMAGVGAVIGGPLAVAAFFFIAPFVGLMWAIVLKFSGKPNILPYGPWLSVASVLAIFVACPIFNFLFPGMC